MTSEEIKEKYSMRDIVERYGLRPNRAGFITCPFHLGDRTPSMKIYKGDFHCYACGANGDIFDFVMRMDGSSFKEAFQSLGGEYTKLVLSDSLSIYRARKKREMAVKQAKRAQAEKDLNNLLISVYRRYMDRFEPFSDGWCDCCERLQKELYRHEILNEMG